MPPPSGGPDPSDTLSGLPPVDLYTLLPLSLHFLPLNCLSGESFYVYFISIYFYRIFCFIIIFKSANESQFQASLELAKCRQSPI